MIKSISTKRASRMGLLGLGVLSMAPLAFADNTTAANAKNVPLNSAFFDCANTLNDSKFYHFTAFANRSYEVQAYHVGVERTVSRVNIVSMQVADNSSMTPALTLNTTDSNFEGSANDDAGFRPRVGAFTAATTSTHYIQLGTNTATGCFYISVRETTLFSPWFSRAAGFEGFIEVHNNTSQFTTITLTAYDTNGVSIGTPLTVAIAPNATVFRTAGQIAPAHASFGGIVLTHDSTFGGVSGNITTLNGANGLSFDSPFTPRDGNVRRF